jgi:hypothetical protein
MESASPFFECLLFGADPTDSEPTFSSFCCNARTDPRETPETALGLNGNKGYKLTDNIGYTFL